MSRKAKPDGYVILNKGRAWVKVTNHPAFGTGYVKRSHWVWWVNTGYKPDWKNKREIVHHHNGDKLDDAFSNLRLWTQGKHIAHHKPALGCKPSEETRRKLSVAKQGNNSRAGIPHTDQIKKQISESLRRSWTPERRAALAQRNRKPNGVFK